MMVKTVSPSGWEWEQRSAAMVKFAGDGGMGPNDRREFVKRAGESSANQFIAQMKNVKFAKDEVPVHLIALGASERYGPNRNGDGFRREVLKKAHDTFVKYAKWFRSHKNKPHEGHPFYGTVKASAYNHEMDRVELLCGLCATKEAADRIGGLVADKEIEKLARDEDIAVSMACSIPFDKCSACHNKARTRNEYCKAASCPGGGCDDNLAKLVKIGNDLHHMHVDNFDPRFFDISNVFRPADRIAYAAGADWMKTAGDDYGFLGVGGAKTANDLGLTAPIFEWREDSVNAKVIRALAAVEGMYDGLPRALKVAFDSTPLVLASIGLDNSHNAPRGLTALADAGIILSLRDYGAMHKVAAEDVAAAAGSMRGIYSRMAREEVIPSTVYELNKAATEKDRYAAHRVARTHGLSKSAVDSRAISGSLRDSNSTFEKSAAATPAGDRLAEEYAGYQVAALIRAAETRSDFGDLAVHTICQNRAALA